MGFRVVNNALLVSNDGKPGPEIEKHEIERKLRTCIRSILKKERDGESENNVAPKLQNPSRCAKYLKQATFTVMKSYPGSG